MSLFTLTFIFFLVMDPLGNCRGFLGTMESVKAERRRWVILREHLIALGLILLFNGIGEFIFTKALHIHEVTIQVATGVILFLIAIRRLFPSLQADQHYPAGEPFIVPLAVPFIAGPSMLAVVMLYAHQEPTEWIMLIAIGISWVLTLALHMIGPNISRTLGPGSLTAFERLSGLFLILLGVQRVMEGMDLFLRSV